MDLITLLVWMFLIGFLFLAIVVFARIYLARGKSRVLHQLSGDTFAMLTGEVRHDKLNVKGIKFDLSGIKAYMLRTALGYKPLYITSYGRNRPLQVKGDFLESEKLSPSTIQSLGEMESLNQLIKSSVGKALNVTTVVFSVMAGVMGFLLGIVVMVGRGGV